VDTNSANVILTPIDMWGMHLANRLAVAPMTRISATAEGYPSQRMARYYEGFARGGFGLLISEGIYPDKAFSQGYLNQPGLGDDEQANAWRPVTAGVHAHGGRIFAQLMHAGALSQGNPHRDHAIGPSAIQPKGHQLAFYRGQGRYPVPEAMTRDHIDEAIEGFVQAAVRATTHAGFDGVEIHGANGYLLDQFLTESSNQRTDEWGGTVAKRVALLAETIRRVRRAVDPRFPVGVRISQGKVNDFHAKWPGGEDDAAIIFRALADAGADFFHVTEFEAWGPAFDGVNSSLVALANRYASSVPVIANGGLHDLERAAQLLESGVAMVAIGRGALANPDMPSLIATGRGLRLFDNSILGPIADIKDSELATSRSHTPEK